MNLNTISFLALVGKANKQPSFIDTLLNGEWGEMKKTRLSYEFVKTRRSWKTHKLQEFVKSTLSNCIAKSSLWSNHYQIAKSTSPFGLPYDLHAAH